MYVISEVIDELFNIDASDLDVKRYHSWSMCDFWREISVDSITEYSTIGSDIWILC